MNSYPRVIIFGQAFNDFSGGGITLSSLFKGWPLECLAVLSYPFMLHNSTTNICQNYYQIGIDELTWRLPFSLVKQKFSSGRLHLRNDLRAQVLKQTALPRYYVSSNLITPFIKWSGLVHSISSIHLSQKLKDWLADFDPEVLYLQISNRESINFARDLIDYLKIPSVIHMMDDWPSTISRRGLFKRCWHKIIDREFRVLLDKTNLHLSISEAMSEEYLTRYGKNFIPFHNSIEPDRFDIKNKVQQTENKNFRILYVGRIGTANRHSLITFAEIISRCDFHGFSVELDIFTKDYDSTDSRKIRRFSNVIIHKAIENNDIPDLLASYNILLLPLDFTDSGRKFSRLSMPTKAIEYMASGTPVLVFAPPETAIYRFCDRNECAHCIPSTDHLEISRSLVILFNDSEYRAKLALNSKRIARQLFDSAIVRQKFRSSISSLLTGRE
jgi:glycosyltransferase involved in cell wall biosynthesis